MSVEDLWFKNAIIYAVDVHRFFDSDGNGRGDFKGLTEKLEYLSELGITCIWLLPFYPTPGRDNGYDVSDYYDIDPDLGTFDDFIYFLHRAGEYSIRVIIDLVMDHTSNEHPWFYAARHDRNSRYRAYYSWTNHPPPVPPDRGNIFPGEEKSVWTYDEVAGAYYFHRFYHFEPDLNTSNPEVMDEVGRVLDFWLSFGISGFRIDAASHMIEDDGTSATKPADPHSILKTIRSVVDKRHPEIALIGEVDVDAQALTAYFGDEDELNLLFNFVLNNFLYLAMARQESAPIVRALKQIPGALPSCQWVNFVRNMDELDLERLSDDEREEVFQAFAPKEGMRIYGRGIRRRVAPMLEGDRRRLELIYSLLFSLPGIPMLVYGDEIMMGEDLAREGRNAVRAPMQWSDDVNGGFSSARDDDLEQPIIASGPFSYKRINVRSQQADPESFLNWMKRLIWTRRETPEFGIGAWHTFEVDSPGVFAHQCTWKDGIALAIHNFTDQKQDVSLDLRDHNGRELQRLLGETEIERLRNGMIEVTLEPFGYRWYRVLPQRDSSVQG